MFAIGIICIAGPLDRTAHGEKTEKTLNNQFAEKDRELEAVSGRKRISASGPAENGNLYGKYFPSAKDADREHLNLRCFCDRRE